MLIGGVMLAAGMELRLEPADYAHGDRPVHFIIERVIGRTHEWVNVVGHEQPTATRPWQLRRVSVRVAALKRSLSL